MQKKTWPLTVFTCVIGALAMFLRWLQLGSITDDATGLLRRGSSISAAVIIIDVLAALLILFFTLRLRGGAKTERLPALPVYRNILQPIIAILGCLILLTGGLTLLLKGAGAQKITAALLISSAAAMAITYLTKRKNKNTGKPSAGLAALSAIPPIAICVLLIIEYRTISREPQLWLYAPRILAYAAAALGFYYIAGFPFGKPKPIRAIFMTQLAGFLCLAAMGDSAMPGGSLILAAFAVMLILESCAIISTISGRYRHT